LALVKVIAVERLLLSSMLIILTITEWAFKSKLTRAEKNRILNYGCIEEEELTPSGV
jgi:hypothetical protein